MACLDSFTLYGRVLRYYGLRRWLSNNSNWPSVTLFRLRWQIRIRIFILAYDPRRLRYLAYNDLEVIERSVRLTCLPLQSSLSSPVYEVSECGCLLQFVPDAVEFDMYNCAAVLRTFCVSAVCKYPLHWESTLQSQCGCLLQFLPAP